MVDLDLLKEEISWKGEVGGSISPQKAMVLWVTAMYPLPCLHYSHYQLWATMAWAPMAAQLVLLLALPGGLLGGHQGSNGQLGSCKSS